MSSFDFNQLSIHKTPEESPGYLLWRASTLWRRLIEEALKPIGLTHPQFVVLVSTAWLTRNEGKVNQVDVGRQACLDPNTTSQILRSLEKKGLIERAFSIDERSKTPFLTSSGNKSLAKALPAVEQADAKFFAAVDLKTAMTLKALQTLANIL